MGKLIVNITHSHAQMHTQMNKRCWGGQNQEELPGISVSTHFSPKRTQWRASRGAKDHVWKYWCRATTRRADHGWAMLL